MVIIKLNENPHHIFADVGGGFIISAIIL